MYTLSDAHLYNYEVKKDLKRSNIGMFYIFFVSKENPEVLHTAFLFVYTVLLCDTSKFVYRIPICEKLQRIIFTSKKMSYMFYISLPLCHKQFDND